MTPERWQRVKELFAAALERPVAERATFLDSACGGDPELRIEVESLLATADTGAFPDAGLLTDEAAFRRAIGGRYRIERELGRGGMATVFLAHDLKHDRSVALKVLHPELALALGTDRFEREIKLAARLQHPNILSVYDSGESAGQFWFTMPYVAGESLRDRLTRERQLPVEEAVCLTREVAEALDYAHRQGVIHRDIKPENILLAEGHALVADFGIARAVGQGDQPLTGTGVAIGTPAYMSPEQASGTREVDARTDVYALGCVLFEMLAGEPPYTGPTPQAIMARALTESPRPIHPMRLAVTEALDGVIAKATAATAADRYGSAAELARALERVGVGKPERRSFVPRVVIRRPVFAALMLGVLLGIGALFAWRRSQMGIGRFDSDSPIDPRHVVAVLPFRNLSTDSSQAYFAAGITEEIAGQVSRMTALRVLSRDATAPYQTAPDRLRRLAAELGAGSVIEGTTRLAGSRVRIGVALTDTRTGQTLWSDQYDRELRDVFALQGDVARQVAMALEGSLSSKDVRIVGHPGTRNPEAYELYLRSANHASLSMVSPAQNRAGIELLQQVIRMDSNFAEAWSGLARRYFFAGAFIGHAYFDSGLVAADRSVALDSELSSGHYARGDLLRALGQVEPARVAYLRALELDPSHAAAMDNLSLLESGSGRYDESLYWAMRAVPLDPNGFLSYFHVSIPLILLGDDATSERWLVAAARRFPDTPRLEICLAWLDLVRGRDSVALERARRLVAVQPSDQEPPSLLANLVLVTRAPDAESVVARLYREGPDAQGWFMAQSYRSLYALLLARRGQRDSAQALWSQALAEAERDIQAGNESFVPRFEIAAIHAARGDTAAALEWLDRAYQAGWREARSIARDPFFDGLREHRRFREIVAQAEGDVVAMRRRAEHAHPALFRKAR